MLIIKLKKVVRVFMRRVISLMISITILILSSSAANVKSFILKSEIIINVLLLVNRG